MNDIRKLDEVILEEIENEVISIVKMEMKKLYAIWNEFGIDIDQKTERVKLVWNHVKILLKDIYEEENTVYEDIKKRITSYTNKIKQLSNVLSVPINEPQGSLIKIEEFLRQELDALIKLKKKRLTVYQELKSEELDYCQILNLQECKLPSNTVVPSEKDILELEHHIQMLKEEKDRRQKKYFNVKKQLATILETTELTPESTFEKDILSGTDTLSLTDETFKALDEVVNKAQKKKEELEKKRTTLLNRLIVLWQRLKVDESTRIEFLSKHVDCRLSTIQSIEQELELCERIKKENIESFVSELRIELLQLWDKCHVSQPERGLFYLFFAAEMSDEVLEEHETEVDKWKKYHANVEHILSKIEKRRELWEMMIVFEDKATDPNRFKNRKGNLLQEEKQRKKLQKDLPALENVIFEDIELLKTQDGITFLYNGEDFKTFVTNQRTERIHQKENEKLERRQNGLQLGNKATLATPAKRLLKTTPKTAPNKFLKSTNDILISHTPTTPSKSRVVPSTVGKMAMKNTRLFPTTPNVIQTKNESILKEIINQVVSGAQASSPNGTTYTHFASELNSPAKHNFRSSVLATKKRGGTRISQTEISRSKKKIASKSRKKLSNTPK